MFCESRVLLYLFFIYLVFYNMFEVWKILLNERINIKTSKWVNDLFKFMVD